MLNNTNFPGLDGFVWWTGIVEGRNDPELLSRVQVRMHVWHTEDKQLIPSENLLWAIPIFPTNSSNNTYCPKEGDAVFGFFIDGKDAQQPYIFGRFPDKPEKMYPEDKGFSDPGKESLADRPVEISERNMVDGEGITYKNAKVARYPNPINEQTTSRFARNQNLANTPLPFIQENTVRGIELAFGGTWDEIQPEYDTKYPYNDSKQSESGHFLDFDDTRDKERINFMHRTGTMYEINHSGTSHIKDLKHQYHIVHGTKRANYRGNLQVTVERFTRFKSKGKTFAEINDCLKVGTGSFIDVASTGEINLNSAVAINITAPLINLGGLVRTNLLHATTIAGTSIVGAVFEGTIAPPTVVAAFPQTVQSLNQEEAVVEEEAKIEE